MRVELASLAECPLPAHRLDPMRTINRFGDGNKSLIPVRRDIPGKVFHNSFLDCLSVAWGSHLGVVVTPDLVWHDLLGEVVGIVKANPDEYRHLFTSDEGKQEIIVQTDDHEVIPLESLCDQLFRRVSIDPNMCFPEFTTTTGRSRMSRYAAFADAASPYYDYGMYCCGIPFVEVRGNYNDWEKLASHWRSLGSQLFTDQKFYREVCGVLNRLLADIEKPDFWRDMFSLERCGSGSQVEVKGWYSQLFREKPPVQYVDNYPPHAFVVDYRNIQTNKNYRMLHGVFSSELNSGLLTPEFGWVVYERKDAD